MLLCFFYFRDTENLGRRQPSHEPDLEDAFKVATNAMNMTPNERLECYYACEQSDNEEKMESQSSDDELIKVYNACEWVIVTHRMTLYLL